DAFGRLKVVLPSPAPYVVPNKLNSAAYVVLLTAAPVISSHPVGAVGPPYAIMDPADKKLIGEAAAADKAPVIVVFPPTVTSPPTVTLVVTEREELIAVA